MRLSAALSVAPYQINIFPYALASCYSFCNGISIIYSSPFPKKEDVEKIKWYIDYFPDNKKKITFEEIPWVYPNTPNAKVLNLKTSDDKRLIGIAGPETASLWNAIYFKPKKIIYIAGDQIHFEHWLNIKPWLNLHWQLGSIIRSHIIEFINDEEIQKIEDCKDYMKKISLNPNLDSQCTIVEPGVCCQGNEGAICGNILPDDIQPLLRTWVVGHFKNWSPLANTDEVIYQRAFIRAHIRNINGEYDYLLSEDEVISKAKEMVISVQKSGMKVGSTPYELITPPTAPMWLASKKPWELLENIEAMKLNAWVPKL